MKTNELKAALELAENRLKAAIQERDKIRKIAKELPTLRKNNKNLIDELTKYRMNIGCLIETNQPQGEK